MDAAGLVPGARLGRFVIARHLGSGGMGSVFEAHDPQLDRSVALKVLRSDRDGGELSLRLLREAQALAQLAHPNVVAVHDVSVADGRVFIAMEYVDGETIDRLLARASRPWREVLALFIQAGRGLAAAHARSIVHRDFKPTNALVDGEGRVRVADFGLARQVPEGELISAPTTDAAAFEDTQVDSVGSTVPGAVGPPPSPTAGLLAAPLTHAGAAVGTPRYMSPEQLAGLPATERSDQYSFCVSLFEALYRRTPFAAATIAELRRETRRGPPPLPAGAAVPRWLGRALQRGLMPAPEARWPSMDALLRALARDPGRTARRGAVLFAALGAVAAAAFAVGTRGRATNPCEGGRARLQGVWDEAARSKMAAAFAPVDKAFARDSFARTAATLDRQAEAWARMHRDACEATLVRGEQSGQLLDARMQCLERSRDELAGLVTVLSERADPQIIARAPEAAAALTDVAACADVRALAALAPLPADPALRRIVDSLEAQVARSRALHDAGRLRDSLEVARATAAAAAAVLHPPLRANAFYQLGVAELNRGQVPVARGAFTAAVRAAVEARDDSTAALAWVGVLDCARRANALDQVPLLVFSAETAVARAGAPARAVAELEEMLGAIGEQQGRYDDAQAHLERAIAVARPHLRFKKLYRLAYILAERGKYTQAEARYREAIADAEGLFGQDHPEVALLRSSLAVTLRRLDRLDEAEKEMTKSLALILDAYGPESRNGAIAYANLGELLIFRGRPQEALDNFLRALAMAEKAMGPEAAMVARVLDGVGAAEYKLGRREDARRTFERSLRIKEKTLGPEHADVAVGLSNVGEFLMADGKHAEALPLFQRSLAIHERSEGPDSRYVIAPRIGIAACLIALRRPREAIPVLERAERIAAGPDGIATDRAGVAFVMARALWDSGGDRRRAVALARKAHVDFGDTSADERKQIAEWLAARGAAAD